MIPPEPKTDAAQSVFTLYNITLAMGAVVFLGVEGFIVYSIFRYRRRDDRLPSQTHGNTLVEIIWTAIPTVIVLILFVLSVVTLARVEAARVRRTRHGHRGATASSGNGSSATWTTTPTPTTTTAWSAAPRRRRSWWCRSASRSGCTLVSRRRDPLLLRAAVPDQARPDPVPGERVTEHAGVHGQRGGHLRRPVRRVLRRPARADDLQRRRP